MAELEKVLKDIAMGGVGVVATAVEKSGELARSMVSKGEETVERSRPAIEKAARRVSKAVESIQLPDVSGWSRELRNELRRRLDEADLAEQAAQEEGSDGACDSGIATEEDAAQEGNTAEEPEDDPGTDRDLDEDDNANG